MEEETPQNEYIEKAGHILAALNIALVEGDPTPTGAYERLCLDELFDVCFAWLNLRKIPFVLDDDTRLYRLRRPGE